MPFDFNCLRKPHGEGCSTFGSRLKEIRKARGLKQKDFAERVGILQPSISLYENGKIIPDVATLEWLCQALDVSATDLLGF